MVIVDTGINNADFYADSGIAVHMDGTSADSRYSPRIIKFGVRDIHGAVHLHRRHMRIMQKSADGRFRNARRNGWSNEFLTLYFTDKV